MLTVRLDWVQIILRFELWLNTNRYEFSQKTKSQTEEAFRPFSSAQRFTVSRSLNLKLIFSQYFYSIKNLIPFPRFSPYSDWNQSKLVYSTSYLFIFLFYLYNVEYALVISSNFFCTNSTVRYKALLIDFFKKSVLAKKILNN